MKREELQRRWWVIAKLKGVEPWPVYVERRPVVVCKIGNYREGEMFRETAETEAQACDAVWRALVARLEEEARVAQSIVDAAREFSDE